MYELFITIALILVILAIICTFAEKVDMAESVDKNLVDELAEIINGLDDDEFMELNRKVRHRGYEDGTN